MKKIIWAIPMAVVIVLISFFIDYGRMGTVSMEPEIEVGSRLLILKVGYQIEPGDIIRYQKPNPSQYFDEVVTLVHRVVGMPNDKIEIRNGGAVWINGKGIEGMAVSTPNNAQVQPNYMTVQLGEDEFYVLGENYMNSLDSRFLGPIRRTEITGKVIAVF